MSRRNRRGKLSRGLALAVARPAPVRLLAHLLSSVRFVVLGDSMEPAFSSGQYLLVSRLAYVLGDPARGDVVVARQDRARGREDVKRVVGLPGEWVRYEGGRLTVNGEPVPEPYLRDRPWPGGEAAREWRLGDGEYLVFGDNRPASTDSRHYGPVPGGALVGRAWYRYWPRGVMGRVPRQEGLRP